MKKLELKFKIKDPFKVLYAVLAIANLAAAYFTYVYARENVYKVLTADSSAYSERASKKRDDIDLKRFEDLVRELEEKGRH